MSRILHLLVLLELALTPTARHGAEAAPAAPQHQMASADGHCGGTLEAPDERDPGLGADCALACSAMPGSGARIDALPMPRPVYAAAPAPFFAGTAPGSDPPPPRVS